MISRRHSIWEVLNRLEEEMDYLFNNLKMDDFGFLERPLLPKKLNNNLALIPSGYRTPLIDFEDAGENFVARIELPGIDKKDIHVHARDGGIEVKASSSNEIKKETKQETMFQKTNYGFYRYFAVPNNADINKVETKYNNGVLFLTIPKNKLLENKGKEIQIK